MTSRMLTVTRGKGEDSPMETGGHSPGRQSCPPVARHPGHPRENEFFSGRGKKRRGTWDRSGLEEAEATMALPKFYEDGGK
jgi:hypothetical protein